MSVNRMPDLCCHTPFSCGHMALSDHCLFVSYAVGVLVERLNERTSISLTCWHHKRSKTAEKESTTTQPSFTTTQAILPPLTVRVKCWKMLYTKILCPLMAQSTRSHHSWSDHCKQNHALWMLSYNRVIQPMTLVYKLIVLRLIWKEKNLRIWKC